jgi:hypothetical protein
VGKPRDQLAEALVARKPQLARAEIIDKATRGRFEAEIDGALKRRPANEAKVAGALRAVAPYSSSLRTALADALTVMVRRGSFKRELYAASLRSLADARDRHVAGLLRTALAGEDGGGSVSLSAACFCADAALTQPLAKLAATRGATAFSAEIARVVRGESNGAHLGALAPMIKESHRIALCTDMLVPLARSGAVATGIGPALKVLRGAERHLGRWLVMAEVAAKAGDPGPEDEAREKSKVGPQSARSAWSLVAWALSSVSGRDVPPPETRPTVELIARLSDRPSADRDTTFLFRMAKARATVCRPMLEALVKALPLADEVAVRAALYLARDHGREDLRQAIVEAARGEGVGPKREELRGVATAALWDLGMRDLARDVADELATSRSIGNVAWAALVRAAMVRARVPESSGVTTIGAKSSASSSSNGSFTEEGGALLHETPVRWIQWGWLE